MTVFGSLGAIGADELHGVFTGDGSASRTIRSTNPDGAGAGPDQLIGSLLSKQIKAFYILNLGDGAGAALRYLVNGNQFAQNPTPISVEIIGPSAGPILGGPRYLIDGFSLATAVATAYNDLGATIAWWVVF